MKTGRYILVTLVLLFLQIQEQDFRYLNDPAGLKKIRTSYCKPAFDDLRKLFQRQFSELPPGHSRNRAGFNIVRIVLT